MILAEINGIKIRCSRECRGCHQDIGKLDKDNSCLKYIWIPARYLTASSGKAKNSVKRHLALRYYLDWVDGLE